MSPPTDKTRRRLSEEDRLLWQKVTATAKALHPNRKLTTGPSSDLPPNPPAKPARPQKPRAGALHSAHKPPPPAPAPQMDRRNYDRMRRGKLAPEARLDLHGLTAGQAHARLNGFIADAQARGLRLVLVITGKGRSSGMDDFHRTGGILRHSLPHWLRQPHLAPLVLEVSPAHVRHGGEGAFYIYLRRKR